MKKVICLVLVIAGLFTVAGASALYEPWSNVDFPGYEIYVHCMYRVYEEYWGHDCYEEIMVLKNQYTGIIDTMFLICKDTEGNIIDGVFSQNEEFLALVDENSPSGTVLNINEKVNEQYENWTVWVY